MIRPLVVDDVPSCRALLSARHESRHPLLGPLSATAIDELLAVDGASGAVSVRDGKVVGYLIGTPLAGASWGANRWVQPAGCAGDDLKDLYAYAAATWVAAGLTAHYAIVPAGREREWFELGFGLQQVFAVTTPASGPVDPRIRRARREDIPVLAALDVVFDQHLVASPVFSGLTPATLEAALADWEASFEDPAFAVFVAVVDDEVVGSAAGCDVSQSSANTGLIVPPHAALLGFAVVQPAARGLGLGRALGTAVSSWAHEQGYPAICADWRATNLTAARTWPRLGYAPTFLRLHRLVGH